MKFHEATAERINAWSLVGDSAPDLLREVARRLDEAPSLCLLGLWEQVGDAEPWEICLQVIVSELLPEGPR